MNKAPKTATICHQNAFDAVNRSMQPSQPRTSQSRNCPMCQSDAIVDYFQDRHRAYIQCLQCHLVFVPTEFYLSADQEKAEYDLHDNQIHDAQYRQFLNRLWEPLEKQLPPSASILEFGCGPGPALADMMQESGYQVTLYDHFYFPDASALKNQYGAITATEVIEHLHQPGDVMTLWLSLLKPGGVIGLMTKLVIDQKAFAGWHYKNDLTHVCFYSRETFNWVSQRYGLRTEIIGKDVILLKQKG